jgi:hypothetical protein
MQNGSVFLLTNTEYDVSVSQDYFELYGTFIRVVGRVVRHNLRKESS